MLSLLDPLRGFSIEATFFKLLCAILFGGVVGIERVAKRRAAGTRTYMLVCMASCLVMVTNQYLSQFGGTDPARLGAQVISGIGFLGAGTIIVTRYNQVVGLTTAAALWASACVGLALGAGYYEGALIVFPFILFIMIPMHGLEHRFISKSTYVGLYLELSPNANFGDVMNYCVDRSFEVESVEFIEPKYDKHSQLAAFLVLKQPGHIEHSTFIANFRKNAPGIGYVEEL
ncbi:MAG: MgtC/SapB family protein [Synergistaceae bacterium]|jgi:putative Mg2+ transporter-C (MgtC) family protein|nr:MgtC/SapB family protein [Synergistaceae bacterium]